MIVKQYLKNGDIRVYEYKDTRKYYETVKEKTGYSVCDVCGSTVMSIYLNKHKTMKKCLKHNDKLIKN